MAIPCNEDENMLCVVIWYSDVLDLGGSFCVLQKLAQDHGVWICFTRKSLLSTSASTTRFTTYQATTVMNSFTYCFIHNYMLCFIPDYKSYRDLTVWEFFKFQYFNVL